MFEEIHKISEEIASFHESHMRNLLKKHGIDWEKYSSNPKILEENGLKLVHEVQGDRHRLYICKVIDKDEYIIKVVMGEAAK
jgi:hypothetical protein